MKLRRTRATRHGRIEIIPMIDVIFFLLVTFMMASLSMQKLNAVGITLPQGAATEAPIEHQITIAVEKDGQIRLDKDPVTITHLTQALQAIVHGSENIIIAADKEARHGDVVAAMLAAKTAGIENFSIAVDNEMAK